MGNRCGPLIAGLFLFCYEKDFMTSLSYNKDAEIIKAFNSTSKYLDDLLNIVNPYFEGIVSRILLPKPHFWIYIYLFQTGLFHPKFMLSAITFILTW